MIDILLALYIGIIIGIFTGLIPGVHINLIASVLTANIAVLYTHITPIQAIIFIISMSITHTFIDSIPGIYLGAPDPSQFLVALPGHKMFLQGKAHKAVRLTAIGGLLSLIFSLSLFGAFSLIIDNVYEMLQDRIGFILIILTIYLVCSKDLKSMMMRTGMFLIAGCYGLIILNMRSLGNPLFHMLSGMFGIAILVESLRSESSIAEQDLSDKGDGEARKSLLPSLIASVAGFIAAFLPGFSTSQNAVIASRIFPGFNEEDFLVLVGGLNTSGMIASLSTFFVLERARNGSIIAIQDLIGDIGMDGLVIIIGSVMISGAMAYMLALIISKRAAIVVQKVDPRKLAIAVISSIAVLSFLFDGIIGITILFFCTCVGLSAKELGVSKNYLMGCIILPVILFFVL